MPLNGLMTVGVLWLATASAVHALPIEDDLLFFEYLGQEREANGQVTQHFALRFNGPELDFLDVFVQQDGDPTLYRAKVENKNVAVSSYRVSFFRLFAFGGSKNRHYIAQADFPGFGNSKIKVKRQPAVPPKEPMPVIDLVSPEFNYWPQTGQRFVFRLNPNIAPNDIELFVLENGRLRALAPDGKRGFSYVPPHDNRLRNESAKACRQDTIIARIKDGNDTCKISYAMRLHRSRTAFLDQKAGVVLLLAAALFFGMWVVRKRKRSITPW